MKDILLIPRRGSEWGPGYIAALTFDGEQTVLTADNGDELRFNTDEMRQALCVPPGASDNVVSFARGLRERRKG